MTRSRTVAVVLVLIALVAGGLLLARAAAPAGLEQQVAAFTERLTPRGPYRPPTDAERIELVAAMSRLVDDPRDGAARDALRRHGFTVEETADEAGRAFLLARSDPDDERSWGLIAWPLDARPRTVIEVPHPNSDLDTEIVGLRVLAAAPDAVYLQAGAHRRAADERADVARAPDSLFHAVAVELGVRRGLPQLQLHGFGDRDDLDDDVVLSSGTDAPADAVRELGRRLTDNGVDVCEAWSRRCRGLEGTTNSQARVAADTGVFAHVELSEAARRDPDQVAAILATFAR